MKNYTRSYDSYSLALILVGFFCFWGLETSLSATEIDECSEKFHIRSSMEQSVHSRALAYEISKNNLETKLRVLTGEDVLFYSHKLEDRRSPANRELTRIYLIGELQKMGLQVVLEKFDHGLNFYADIVGNELPNEIFEVAAHYDTAGIGVPGADDNGTGLVSLLEMARVFLLNPPKRTLRLTFLDLEESNSFNVHGADRHVEQIKREFSNFGSAPEGSQETVFVASLIVDMIGYAPKICERQKIILEVGRANQFPSWLGGADAFRINRSCAKIAGDQFLRFAGKDLQRGDLELKLVTQTAMPDSADHGSYWSRGVPAMLLAPPYESPYINPKNHSAGDKLSMIHWEYFLKAVEFAVEITASMLEAKSTMPEEILDSVLEELTDNSHDIAEAKLDSFQSLVFIPPKPPKLTFVPKKVPELDDDGILYDVEDEGEEDEDEEDEMEAGEGLGWLERKIRSIGF